MGRPKLHLITWHGMPVYLNFGCSNKYIDAAIEADLMRGDIDCLIEDMNKIKQRSHLPLILGIEESEV